MAGEIIRTKVFAGIIAILLVITAGVIAASLTAPAQADDSAGDSRVIATMQENEGAFPPEDIEFHLGFGELIPIQAFS